MFMIHFFHQLIRCFILKLCIHGHVSFSSNIYLVINISNFIYVISIDLCYSNMDGGAVTMINAELPDSCLYVHSCGCWFPTPCGVAVHFYSCGIELSAYVKFICTSDSTYHRADIHM
jgi:hypothetical protein